MSCCTVFYERPEVRELMGESFHPGGAALTAATIADLGLTPGARVLDVACGTGLTTLALAREHGASAVGIDLGADNLAQARARGESDALDVTFVHGDAAELPFDDDSFDAVTCECALSTFDDNKGVLAEIARVTRRGGRLGLSDMAVYGRLPPRVAELAGPWACLGAGTVEETQRVLLDAGFRIVTCHDESARLHELALDLKRRLVVVGLGQVSGLFEGDVDLDNLRGAIDQARAAVTEGVVQYFRLSASLGPVRTVSKTATQPAPTRTDCDPATGCC